MDVIAVLAALRGVASSRQPQVVPQGAPPSVETSNSPSLPVVLACPHNRLASSPSWASWPGSPLSDLTDASAPLLPGLSEPSATWPRGEVGPPRFGVSPSRPKSCMLCVFPGAPVVSYSEVRTLCLNHPPHGVPLSRWRVAQHGSITTPGHFVGEQKALSAERWPHEGPVTPHTPWVVPIVEWTGTHWAYIGVERPEASFWGCIQRCLRCCAGHSAHRRLPCREPVLTASAGEVRPPAQRCVDAQGNGRQGERTNSDDVRLAGSNPLAPRQADPSPDAGVSCTHARQLAFNLRSSYDPLSTTSTDFVYCPEVDLIAQILGADPAEYERNMREGKQYCRATWTDRRPRAVGGPHGPITAVYGAPTHVLELLNGFWTLYEYHTPQMVARMATHPASIASMSVVSLLAAADKLDGVSSGTTASFIRETGLDTPDGLRHEVAGLLARHTASEGEAAVNMAAQAGAAHAEARHISVREIPINGSNGSCGDKDDVKVTGQKTKPRKKEGLRQRANKLMDDAAKQAGRVGGAALATGVGAPELAPVLSKLGERALPYVLKRLRVWSGMGSYEMGLVKKSHATTIRKNTILHGTPVTNLIADPSVCSLAAADDYVGCITQHPLSAGSTWVIALRMNPGNANLFPNASAAVASYQQYSPVGLILTAQMVMAPFSTNGPIGTVAVCFERDIGAPAPTTVEAVMRRENPMLFKASESWAYAIECDPASWGRKSYNIRVNGSPMGATVDESEFDCGILYIAVNVPSTVAASGTLLGHLRMSSHWCVGRKEVAPAAFGKAHLRRTVYDATNIFGTTASEQNGAKIGSLVKMSGTSTKLSFPELPNGTDVLLVIRWISSGAGVTWVPPSRSVEYLTASSVLSEGASILATPLSGTSTNTASLTLAYKVAGALGCVPTLTLSGGTLPTNTPVTVETIVNTGTVDPVEGYTV